MKIKQKEYFVYNQPKALTPKNRILIGKLIVAEGARELPSFCGMRMFITVFT
jgi:hypothetical protein